MGKASVYAGGAVLNTEIRGIVCTRCSTVELYEEQLRGKSKKKGRHMRKSRLTVPKEETGRNNGKSRFLRQIQKGEHKRWLILVCDKHNFILDTVVTSRNVHDSTAFDKWYEKVTEGFAQVETVTMDVGYKISWICKRIPDDRWIPSLAYKRLMTKKGFHEWYKYVYDEYMDIVISPKQKSLNDQCRKCPIKEQ